MSRSKASSAKASPSASSQSTGSVSPLWRTTRGSYWETATVVALGAVSILMLLTTNWVRERWIAQDIALTHALCDIRTDIAISHLWIEEYVSGDTVDLSRVLNSLERATRLAGIMLDGGWMEAGEVSPLTEPELRELVVRLANTIEHFATLSEERLDHYAWGGTDVGIGSTRDVEYDRVFEDLVTVTSEVKQSVDRRLARDYRRSRLLFRGVVAAWVLIVTVAVVGLGSRERRRRRAEAALLESEERFLQSQKMEALGRLAGGLAHDINNYLAAVSGQCELVRMEAPPESRLAGRMDAVLSTTLRITSLIQRLLAFSRKQQIQPQVVSLNQVVNDLETMMRRLIGEDVELTTRLDPRLWSVHVDPSQIEQILVNLVVNAREAMPTGGRLRVRTANRPSSPEHGGDPLTGGDWVLLTVTDDGPGIPREIRGKIFDPFFTTKEGGGSSGLGLATVYGIVEQNRGQIWVESPPSVPVGKASGATGTCFCIALPRTWEAPSAQSRSASELQDLPQGSEQILLVEDNPDFRRSTRELLTFLGYKVTSAPDAESALAFLSVLGDELDLVITDVVLSDRSGKELADEIHGQRPRLPVLFISGYTDDVVLRHGILTGEVHFLAKPFSAGQLARTLREVLGASRDAQPSGSANGTREDWGSGG